MCVRGTAGLGSCGWGRACACSEALPATAAANTSTYRPRVIDTPEAFTTTPADRAGMLPWPASALSGKRILLIVFESAIKAL
jgi:hypothetical protein